MPIIKKQKQLEMFSPAECLLVDTALSAALVEKTKQLIQTDQTKQRFCLIAPETLYNAMPRVSDSADYSIPFPFYQMELQLAPKRILTFQRNCSCVSCGRTGNVFIAERHLNDPETISTVNLYSVDEHGIELFTVDHILPDSLGGRYHPSNFQTMCRTCNAAKRNSLTRDEIKSIVADPARYAKSWVNHKHLIAVLSLLDQIEDAPEPHKPSLRKLYTAQTKLIRRQTTPKLAEQMCKQIDTEYKRITSGKTGPRKTYKIRKLLTRLAKLSKKLKTIAVRSWHDTVRAFRDFSK